MLNRLLDSLNRWLLRLNRALEVHQIRKARENERRLGELRKRK